MPDPDGPPAGDSGEPPPDAGSGGADDSRQDGGSDGADDPPEQALDAAEPFQLFSHELRIDVLRALWREPDHALGYAELKDRVGERDSGKFNYHLSQLVGQFVGHDGEEYELLYAGHRVLDAIESGYLHGTVELGPVDLEGSCPRCGGELQFTYADHIATVACVDCEAPALAFAFDPGGVRDRDAGAAVAAFDRRTRHVWSLAADGICPICSGAVSVGLSRTAGKSAGDPHFADDHAVVADVDCRQCSFYATPPVGVALLIHPYVPGLLYERGVDLRATRLWELDFVVDPGALAVRSEDPWEVTVETTAGGEALRFAVDGDLRVRSLERSFRAPDPP